MFAAWVLVALAILPGHEGRKISEHFHERQLTHGLLQKDLDDNINFSPDGRYLVFDCRDEKGINDNSRLGKVDVKTGETTVFYTQKPRSLGVGAASFLNNHQIVAIQAL